MLIEMNVNTLLANGMTATEFTMLTLLWEKKENTAREYFKIDDTAKTAVQQLLNKKYIVRFDSKGYSVNRTKCIELFGLEKSHFWELYNTYPLKVSNGRSVRVLRTGSPHSEGAKVCLAKYKARIKTKARHDYVMRCLQAELSERKKGNSFKYMLALPTWLNQHHWEKYEYLLERNNYTSNDAGYGNELV
jgi:hypothetical protein